MVSMGGRAVNSDAAKLDDDDDDMVAIRIARGWSDAWNVCGTSRRNSKASVYRAGYNFKESF